MYVKINRNDALPLSETEQYPACVLATTKDPEVI